MRKYISILVVIILSILTFNVTAYAGVDFSKVVNALQKLPYLYEFVQEFFIVNNSFSIVLFKLVKMFGEFILCIIILSAIKNFVCQEAVIVNKEIKRVLFSGSIAYILILSLLIMFFASFIGFPIAVIILFVVYMVVLIGKTALITFVGYFIETKLKKNWHIYLDYLLGAIVIELIGFIPYMGQFFLFCIVPIISIGIFIISILNKFIYKKYYTVPFCQEISEKKYSRADIRKIIVREIDK